MDACRMDHPRSPLSTWTPQGIPAEGGWEQGPGSPRARSGWGGPEGTGRGLQGEAGQVLGTPQDGRARTEVWTALPRSLQRVTALPSVPRLPNTRRCPIPAAALGPTGWQGPLTKPLRAPQPGQRRLSNRPHRAPRPRRPSDTPPRAPVCHGSSCASVPMGCHWLPLLKRPHLSALWAGRSACSGPVGPQQAQDPGRQGCGWCTATGRAPGPAAGGQRPTPGSARTPPSVALGPGTGRFSGDPGTAGAEQGPQARRSPTDANVSPDMARAPGDSVTHVAFMVVPPPFQSGRPCSSPGGG